MQINAKKSLGLIFFPALDWAISPSHPEREERLLYTRDQILEEGLLDIKGIEEYNPRLASFEEINRTHICLPQAESIVTEPHLISAGGAIKAGELVMEGEVDSAFAIIRPPGHHAFRVVHGSRGFCTINNEAIMVEHLRYKYGPELKIAFVDTDAHHADGTQDIFYNDPNVLHISLHQDGRTLFPGTGSVEELGGPGAYGYTINLPLPPNTSDQGLHYALDNLVLPILDDFEPDLVINAAGQDNHYSDPLTRMRITAQGYAELNSKLNPDLAILQGGYSIEGALPYINVGLILAMAGLDYSHIQEPDYDPTIKEQSTAISEDIKRNVDSLLKRWKSKDKINIQKKFGTDEYYHSQRSIFYDTDQIRENQNLSIKICPHCSGLISLESQVQPDLLNTGQAKILVLPFGACKECRNEAAQKFEQFSTKSNAQSIYLQDKEKGELLKNTP